MFDVSQVAQAEKRYEERTPERTETEARIQAGEILEANPPDHVRQRLRRKGLPEVLTEEIMSGARSTGAVSALETAEAPVLNVLERVLGTNELIEVNFLIEGARVARSVCRVEIGDAHGLAAGYGSGVMVSPRLLLTNNHVLESAAMAAASVAEFDFQRDEHGVEQQPVRFGLDPDVFFVTDVDLDFSLVAVRETSESGKPLADYGWVPLILQQGKVIKGECVNIIQHPSGEPKQVALRQNQVVDLLVDFMHYKTDTAPGSSGAPVFNDEWELVALHHSGVPARDANNNILAIDGSIWTEPMGEHRVKWIANEGVRISRIIAHAGGLALAGAQRDVLNVALHSDEGAAVSTPPGIGLTAPREHVEPEVRNAVVEPGGVTVIDDAGTMTWTIPLHVSVRLGSPVPSGTAAAPGRPVRIDSSGSPAAATPEVDGDALAEALAELERGRRQPYYAEAADKRDREQYYRDLPRRRTPASFFTALHDLLTTTHATKPAYQPSKRVYPWVDLQPNRKLRSIYTGDEYEPETFIQEDLQIERVRAERMRERFSRESTLGSLQIQEALDTIEATLPYNCEHVVPQSWFGKAEPMKGDLHHLFACEGRCNSFRRNTPYFEFTDFNEAIREKCGKAEGNRFEPVRGKGTVARATFYFLLRYPGQINRIPEEYEAERIALLLEWHRSERPGDYERHRNAAIFAVQGNRNPLIDFPEWADEIDFSAGLG